MAAVTPIAPRIIFCVLVTSGIACNHNDFLASKCPLYTYSIPVVNTIITVSVTIRLRIPARKQHKSIEGHCGDSGWLNM